jgi:hypothetical protein
MKKTKRTQNHNEKNLPNKRPRTTNHYTTIYLSNIRNTNTPIFYTKQHQGNYSTQHMTEPAPMSRGSSLTGAPPTSRTGKVAWRGDRNKREPPRNAKKPRGPSPKGTPPASRTEKSPGGGAISHLQVMYKRVSNNREGGTMQDTKNRAGSTNLCTCLFIKPVVAGSRGQPAELAHK